MMIETITIAKPVSQRRSSKPATVSASAVAQHLDCSRTYIGKLEGEGVIQRHGGGFLLDKSRVAYLRYLRRERQQSPRAAADAEFTAAKAELIRVRIMEKKKVLIVAEEAYAQMEQLVGLFLTALSSMPAQCAPIGDMQTRRRLEAWVFQTRTALADAANQLADQAGEPADAAT